MIHKRRINLLIRALEVLVKVLRSTRGSSQTFAYLYSISPSEINIEDQSYAISFHKRTSAIWNDFERVMIDEVLKVKYKNISYIVVLVVGELTI